MLALNKEYRSLRCVSKWVGAHHITVKNVLDTSGAKPYHKYKTQKLYIRSREWRFQNGCSKHFGCTKSQHKLRFLVNTDFSAKIKTNPTRNTKNDVVWATSRDAVGDKLESREEKYSVGVMIWGGISWKGMVPSERPIFKVEFYENYNPTPKNVNGNMYADLVRDYAGLVVYELN